MKTIVSGAHGMLGSDVVRACVARDHEVYAFGHAELDITNAAMCEEVLADVRPGCVINCAAWTDVDGAEAAERGAMAVNDTGAALLATACAAHGSRILQISSDYVFNGEKRSPYVEEDMPQAISAYGRSKQAGETSVAVSNPNHLIVRTSWLFGVQGQNFVETMLRLAGEQSEVVVVTDQVGTPTYTRHLAPVLAELVEGDARGIRHAAASGQCSWFEFAQEIFDQTGVECRVMAGTSDMIARPAPRPGYSVLDSLHDEARQLPEWRQGLRDYLAERRAGTGAAS